MMLMLMLMLMLNTTMKNYYFNCNKINSYKVRWSSLLFWSLLLTFLTHGDCNAQQLQQRQQQHPSRRKIQDGGSCPKNQIQSVGPYMLTDNELETCEMNLSALNSNEMSQDLYVVYINATYVDLVHNGEFDSLPLPLQRAYTISACNCLPGSADCPSSCTAETSFVDLSVLSMDSVEASVRIFKICGRIQYGYEVSHTPSLPPTPAPTPSPSQTPNSQPSPGPSMMASSQPTADPTGTPTDAPTPIASMQPSKDATPAPYASPSAGPTLFTGSLAIKVQVSKSFSFQGLKMI